MKNIKLKKLVEKFQNDLEDFTNQPGYDCFNIHGQIDELKDILFDMDQEDEDESLDAEADE